MTEFADRHAPLEAVVMLVARTLADVIAAIEGDSQLSSTRKRDLCSAVRRVCALLGFDPAATPASMRVIRERLDGFDWRQTGITKKTFQTIRSNMQFAIRRYALLTVPTRGKRLSRKWKALWDRITDKQLRYRLSRFMAFCSAFGIDPSAVDEQTFVEFLAWLIDRTLVKRPGSLHRKTLLAWNRATETVPDWLRACIAVPSNGEAYCLAWEDLPEPLRRDAEAWLDCLAHADPLADKGPLRPVRPHTVTHRRFQIRQIVSALSLRGHDITRLTALADLVEVETAKEVLRFFLDRNAGETSSQIGSLASLLCAIAEHWVEVDDDHLQALKRIRGQLAYRVHGLTKKNRERLVQFADRDNLERFLMLPQKIHERMRKKRRLTVTDARLVKVVLALEMLLMMPIRRNNLVGLSLERHILRTGKGRHAKVYVLIPEDEVKNTVDLTYELPPDAVALLDFYLDRCRPLLSSDLSEWLFPGDRAERPSNPDQFSRQFTKTVRDLTGLKVNMHLMRHLGAKLYLDRNPGAYEVVRRVLGHKSLSTTVNSYTGLETEAALRHFDAVILGIRDGILRETKEDSDDDRS